jgi:hypothetical protein
MSGIIHHLTKTWNRCPFRPPPAADFGRIFLCPDLFLVLLGGSTLCANCSHRDQLLTAEELSLLPTDTSININVIPEEPSTVL